MLSEAKGYLGPAPQTMLYPGGAIFLMVLGFNLLGDGLRDVLDPRTRLLPGRRPRRATADILKSAGRVRPDDIHVQDRSAKALSPSGRLCCCLSKGSGSPQAIPLGERPVADGSADTFPGLSTQPTLRGRRQRPSNVGARRSGLCLARERLNP